MFRSTRSCLLETILLLLFSTLSAQASHLQATQLSYAPVPGWAGQYRLTLHLFIDCGIFSQPVTPQIKAISGAGTIVLTTLSLISATEVSAVCPGQSTECNGGGGLASPGIEKREYSGLIQLPPGAPEWTFSYEECCRDSDNILGSVGFYTEAFLNVQAGEVNSSPVFGPGTPVPYFVRIYPSSFSLMATDPDGDSLVYSLVPALGGSAPNPTPVTYATSYSASQPFGTAGGAQVQLDPETRLLSYNVSASGSYTVVIKIEEYRSLNGQVTLVGSSRRDVNIRTIFGSVASAAGPVSVTGSGAVVNSAASVSVLPGSNLQLILPASSGNANYNITLSANSDNELPGSVFTTSGTAANVTGQLSWTPTAAHVRSRPYYVTYRIVNNACPIPDEKYGVIRIRVSSTLLTRPEETGSAFAIPGQLNSTQAWELPAALQGSQVIVRDATGREVYHSRSYANRLRARDLPSGLYLYQIVPAGQDFPVTGRLLLQP